MSNINKGGPLNRMLGGLGLDDKLPLIPKVQPIDTMPVTIGVPVTASTPRACICPTCRIFEKEEHASMCPRCTLRGELRAMNAEERRRYYEGIDREISERDAMRQRAERQVRADAQMIHDTDKVREERSRD